MSVHSRRIDRRLEHRVFFFLNFSMAAMIVYGFAHTYFLAPLPNLLVHLHAAFFSSWVLLIVVQSGLVWAGRLQWHRTLGMIGFAIAAGMVVLGTATARFALAAHRMPPGIPPLQWHFVQISAVLFAFPLLVSLAFLYRRNPQAHKRLILLATLTLIDAGIDRWPIMQRLPLYFVWVSAIIFSYVLLLAIYDRFAWHKIHRVTLWGGLSLVAFRELRWHIGGTQAWGAACVWARSHGFLSF
jgi:hypothetical protein